MSFSTIPFLFFFLPAALLIYRAVPAKLRPVLLILISLVFYAWGDVRHLPVLVFSMVFTYVAGLEIGMYVEAGAVRRARFAVISSVAVNVILLVYYKFSAQLPLGISFFTFSAISYLLDIYMERADYSRRFIDAAAYICMFPKLISGPIAQWNEMRGQFRAPEMTSAGFCSGTKRFVVGLFKKVLLADALGAAFAAVSAQGSMASGTAWLGMIFYSLQLLFDFSGYSDMAIGIAEIMGFRIRENFDYPYAADGIADFWRRWHISLGRWFRDYVYIPLGGNRCSAGRQIINLLVVWILTGFWHGSDLSFVVWGLYHGALVILERFVLSGARKRVPREIRTAVTVFLVFFGWIFFFSPTVAYSAGWISQMFGGAGLGTWDPVTTYFLRDNAVLLVFSVLCCTPVFGKLLDRIPIRSGKPAAAVSAGVYTALFLCCVAYIVGSSYSSFLYFAF